MCLVGTSRGIYLVYITGSLLAISGPKIRASSSQKASSFSNLASSYDPIGLLMELMYNIDFHMHVVVQNIIMSSLKHVKCTVLCIGVACN